MQSRWSPLILHRILCIFIYLLFEKWVGDYANTFRNVAFLAHQDGKFFNKKWEDQIIRTSTSLPSVTILGSWSSCTSALDCFSEAEEGWKADREVLIKQHSKITWCYQWVCAEYVKFVFQDRINPVTTTLTWVQLLNWKNVAVNDDRAYITSFTLIIHCQIITMVVRDITLCVLVKSQTYIINIYIHAKSKGYEKK